MRRQTYGYLPSRRASPPLDWYQIILLGDWGTCVWTTCPRLLPNSGTAEIRTRDCLSCKSNTLAHTDHWAGIIIDLCVCAHVQEVRAAVCGCSTRCRSCSATSTTAARSRLVTTTATGCQRRSRWRRWWTRSLGRRYATTLAAAPSARLPRRSLHVFACLCPAH